MYLSEEALRTLTRDEIVILSLEYQNKFTSNLARIKSDIGNLRKDLTDLAITRNFYNPTGGDLGLLKTVFQTGHHHNKMQKRIV